MNILVINGPNLNLLGSRKPDVYGHKNLEEVYSFINGYFKRVDLEYYQTNHEGEIIDKIQQACKDVDGIVINPGAYTHYSYAIRDAIEACPVFVSEVHISNVHNRENFRSKSVISDVCQGTVSGFGVYGYVIAIQALAHKIKRAAE